jgi:hypothetical protein
VLLWQIVHLPCDIYTCTFWDKQLISEKGDVFIRNLITGSTLYAVLAGTVSGLNNLSTTI